LHLAEDVEESISRAASLRELNRWIIFHTYAVVSSVASLRDKADSLLDLEGLHGHISPGDGPYIVITLHGTVKEESNNRAHLLPCVLVTSSAINVKA
jgi:hypothetical protein